MTGRKSRPVRIKNSLRVREARHRQRSLTAGSVVQSENNDEGESLGFQSKSFASRVEALFAERDRILEHNSGSALRISHIDATLDDLLLQIQREILGRKLRLELLQRSNEAQRIILGDVDQTSVTERHEIMQSVEKIKAAGLYGKWLKGCSV